MKGSEYCSSIFCVINKVLPPSPPASASTRWIARHPPGRRRVPHVAWAACVVCGSDLAWRRVRRGTLSRRSRVAPRAFSTRRCEKQTHGVYSARRAWGVARWGGAGLERGTVTGELGQAGCAREGGSVGAEECDSGLSISQVSCAVLQDQRGQIRCLKQDETFCLCVTQRCHPLPLALGSADALLISPTKVYT